MGDTLMVGLATGDAAETAEEENGGVVVAADMMGKLENDTE